MGESRPPFRPHPALPQCTPPPPDPCLPTPTFSPSCSSLAGGQDLVLDTGSRWTTVLEEGEGAEGAHLYSSYEHFPNVILTTFPTQRETAALRGSVTFPRRRM